MTTIQRRSLLIGLGSLLAAPAIVRAQNIMPVRALRIGDGAALNSMAHPEMHAVVLQRYGAWKRLEIMPVLSVPPGAEILGWVKADGAPPRFQAEAVHVGTPAGPFVHRISLPKQHNMEPFGDV